MEAYYYSKMNKTEKQIYHGMKTGLLALEPSFHVPLLEGRELQDIFFKLRLDCPEIFYAVAFRYIHYRNADHVEIVPEYLFDKKKIIEHQKAMKARIAKLVRMADVKTEVEKECYIHDFICTQVNYDKLKKPYSHEIIGPLGHGVGVCEGIAKTVKVLCDALNIWCIVVISEANPDQGIKYRHAWNVIKIDGKNFHLDATFDNNLSSKELIRYDYFNLDDKKCFRDHEPVIYGAPPCSDSDHFYYKEKKLSFTKKEQVASRALQSIRKRTPLVFHWRGGHLSHEVLAELINVLEQAASQKGKHAKAGLNRTQNVIQVVFDETVPADEVIIQFADNDRNHSETSLAINSG